MKYLIKINIGYGDDAIAVDCESQEQADKEAYEYWHSQVQDNADYSAEILTKELAEDYSLEDELD